MGDREMRERIWRDQITLPDEVEKWVVSTLSIGEYCYVKKIPDEDNFLVSRHLLDLGVAFMKMEVARRCKDDPRRYGWRRGDRFMFLASCTSGVIFYANLLRKALGEPEFVIPKRKAAKAAEG